MRTKTCLPRAQPRPPWAVPAGRGQQLGGRSLPRAARRRPARGALVLSVGRRTRTHHYPSPTLRPRRTSDCVEGRGCVRGSLRRALRSCSWKNSGGRPCPCPTTPGPPGVKGSQSPEGPGTRVGGDFRVRCSVAALSSGGPPLRPGSRSPGPGLFPLSGLRQRPAARGPSPFPLGFRGPDQRPLSAKVRLPPPLTRPECSRSGRRAPRGRGADSCSSRRGQRRGRGPVPATGQRGRRTHLTVGSERLGVWRGRRVYVNPGCAGAP